MPSLRLEHVTKRYGRSEPAVDDLSLEVAEGELLVLVGPSGCGKTTTLRLIAGLERAETGTIRIGGRVVDRLAPHARDVAMVFQNYALYPHLTVFDNLAFALRMQTGGFFRRSVGKALATFGANGSESRLRERALAVAEQLSLTALLARYPRQLSGGERQRVAVGRALLREPAAFLFDEPLSNLDVRLRERTRRELKRLHRASGAAAIYVTHDQQEAMTLGDRVAVLHRGRLQQIGSPAEAYDRPRNTFVAGFFGSPGMNLVEGCLTGEGGEATFRGGGLLIPFPRELSSRAPQDRRVTLGFRPHEAELVSRERGQGRFTVETAEDVGDAVLVALGGAESAGVTLARGKSSAASPLHPGTPCGILFSDSRLHWFATETGDNLRTA
ncbi:MAG TPA: ABC transporter ATP-binding protein [Pirellulaceae bacterium]|nr:ABC transporter ATP-binding protein [Pirellulaceae bacterium]